ncbi:MAG TPA: glycoside hydrolase family 88 protein [Opitutaceae bacterium]|nr:glycoside hydrolase family 88 protein [Opitutaceae bacterium]
MNLRRTAAAVLLALASLGVVAEQPTPSPFTDWPAGADPREVGRRVAARFLASPHAFWPEFGTISYSEVCVWTGAVDFAAVTADHDLAARLAARFTPFFTTEAALVPPPNHVDNSVFGALPLALAAPAGDARLRPLGLRYADTQWARPSAEGLSDQTRFWIDDMYMIAALQGRAFRATGDTVYLDRAARSMVAYLDRLQRPNGLFFHAPDAPHHWGRGNGWMAAGLTLLLSDLPESHPLRPRLLAGYHQMMATLLELQTPEGLWRQLLDQPDAWPESSCTGMFAYAFVTGVKRGWLDAATYAPPARRAWLALVAHLEPTGEIREVCVGTGTKDDRQHYLDRPRRTGDFHGQAPLLWTATALLAP